MIEVFSSNGFFCEASPTEWPSNDSTAWKNGSGLRTMPSPRRTAVVDRAMTVLRELAQVLDVNLHNAGFGGAANDSMIQGPAKIGKDGDEVKAHRREV